MEKIKKRREDRRTIYTKNVIKDAMLELLDKMSFEKITVSALCRQAEIVRTTFYLHYDNLTDVLKELADDAILAAGNVSHDTLQDVAMLAEKMRVSTDSKLLEPYMTLLPVCQRVSDDPKYRVMFQDDVVSSYILKELYRQEVKSFVEVGMSRFRLTKIQAEKLFLFLITGAFQVNKTMGWKKDPDWYEVQKVLLTFISGGSDTLECLFN